MTTTHRSGRSASKMSSLKCEQIRATRDRFARVMKCDQWRQYQPKGYL
jgi:hypothetical protein